MVEFLNYHFFFLYYFSFLSFYSIIHSFLFFFFFFFLLIFLHHTRIPIYPIPSLFVFSTFHFPEPPSGFLSFSSSLSQNFFFFIVFLQFSFSTFFFFIVIRIREIGRERKNRWVRWLRSAAAARRPLPLPLVFLPTQPRW